MIHLSAAWLATILLITLAVGVVGYRFVRSRGSDFHDIYLKLVIVGVLVAALFISALFSPAPPWMVLLRVLAIYWSLFLARIAIGQILNNRPYQSVVYHQQFPGFVALSSTGALLAYMREAGTFEHSYPLLDALITYTSYCVTYGSHLYNLLSIVSIYWKSFDHYTNLTYVVRRAISMIGMGCALVSVGSYALAQLFAPVLDTRQSLLLQQITMHALPLTFILQIIGFMTPHSLLAYILSPIERWMVERQRRQREQLRYLHQRMVQLVPTVQLLNDQLLDIRMPIEISDARQIMWSHMPRSRPITANDEAGLIFHLLQGSTIITHPGPYLPPPLSQRNVIRYNLAVAAELKRLEASQPVPSRSSAAARQEQIAEPARDGRHARYREQRRRSLQRAGAPGRRTEPATARPGGSRASALRRARPRAARRQLDGHAGRR